MTNKFSLISNSVLGIAVIVLFYLHFSTNSSTNKNVSMSNSKDTSSVKVILNKDGIKQSKIVFVNTDSLTFKYHSYKKAMEQLQQKKVRLENQFNQQAAQLETQVRQYQEKGSKGALSAEEIQNTEMRLGKQRDEILQSRDAQGAQLMEEEKNVSEKLFKKIEAYIKSYCEQAGYEYVLGYTKGGGVLYANGAFDITNDIVEGLNADSK